MRVTLLGTGTSVGIPIIGCTCRVCTSTDPRDVRSRCSCLVQTQGMNILIDAGPDFRQQALRAGLVALDALLITHHHHDHVAGLDDLRPYFFENRKPIPCFASASTQHALMRMFPWIFDLRTRYATAPRLQLEVCVQPFAVHSRYGGQGSVRVTPIVLRHGSMDVLGFRIGHFAYLTDTNYVPEAAYEDLKNLDVLVIDGLRYAPHRTHLSIDEAIAVAARVGARRTFLIHMTHTVLHAEVDAALPQGVALAYDGLSFDVRKGS